MWRSYCTTVPFHPGGLAEHVEAERDHQADAGHTQGRRPDSIQQFMSLYTHWAWWNNTLAQVIVYTLSVLKVPTSSGHYTLFQKPVDISMINHWGNWVKVINHWTFNENRSININWKLSQSSLTKYFNEYPLKIQLLFIVILMNIGWTFNERLYRFKKMWLSHDRHNKVASLHIYSACLLEKLFHWCIFRRTPWSDDYIYIL
jgi:hypothetical protein